MPVSLPDQIKPQPQPQPPQPTSPQYIISFVAVALVGLFVGIAADELRWRGSAGAPRGQLVQAEHDFQAGDSKAALKLFSALADKNDPIAEYWLAHMTELGLGVPHDPTKAIDLYKKAAEQNVEAAELRLGQIYLDGNLVPPDFAQAKTYLEKSAYEGNPHAAMMLGQMYRIGLGMKADPTEAYAWSEVATLEGNVFAERERNASFRDLSTDDQKAAVMRAREILKTIKGKTITPTVPESK